MDSVASQYKSIDLLIGPDYFYDFVTGEVVEGSSGLLVMKSKLGGLLSGPCKSYSDSVSDIAIVCSHFVLDSSPQQIYTLDKENACERIKSQKEQSLQRNSGFTRHLH